MKLLPAVMKMLRALVQHCHDVRHKLAHESSIYYSVLRCKSDSHIKIVISAAPHALSEQECHCCILSM